MWYRHTTGIVSPAVDGDACVWCAVLCYACIYRYTRMYCMPVSCLFALDVFVRHSPHSLRVRDMLYVYLVKLMADSTTIHGRLVTYEPIASI